MKVKTTTATSLGALLALLSSGGCHNFVYTAHTILVNFFKMCVSMLAAYALSPLSLSLSLSVLPFFLLQELESVLKNPMDTYPDGSNSVNN